MLLSTTDISYDVVVLIIHTPSPEIGRFISGYVQIFCSLIIDQNVLSMG